MPTATYTPLANITLGTAASTVTFSSIPATYRDLVFVVNVVGLSGNPDTRGGYFTVNGTGGSTVHMYGAGSGVSGTDATDMILPYGNYHNMSVINIMDYSATDKHKTILHRAGAASNVSWAISSRWANTSAVTSVSFIGPDSGADSFAIGSTFTLYGIAA